jgi:hypothetical protein
MNRTIASKFIGIITGKNREILLEIINKLFFAIHDLLLNDFNVPKKNEKLFEIKRSSTLSDFSGAADLFRTNYYFNKKFPRKYNHEEKLEKHSQISLLRLEKEIRFLNDELVRERIKGQICNEYFNLDAIDQIAKLVIDINTLRNREEHELTNFDFSQASLLFGYVNRLLALTPDYILESSNEYHEYQEYLNCEFKKLTKIFIPVEDEEEISSKAEARTDLNIEDLAKRISQEIKKESDQKDKEIKRLKSELEHNYFYTIDKKKSIYNIERNDFYKIMPIYYTDKDSNIYNASITTSEWSWENDGRPEFFMPNGAVADDKGDVYIFYDKNDPYFMGVGKKNANEYMFSVEEIEDSWGPFDKPLELIREMSVVMHDDSYTSDEHEAKCIVDEYKYGLSNQEPTEKQKKLVKKVEMRPPISIPIAEWRYPKTSYAQPLKKASQASLANLANYSGPQRMRSSQPTVETIIRKTRKETEEQLLELRNKIYTIMTNHTVFDHWDNILSSKIIKNILNDKIFSIEDFKKSNTKPGYVWKTASKEQPAPFVKRDQASSELMDLQINQFWSEIQDITRNYFFDYDYIYNNKNMPWVKASLKYTEKDYKENTDIYIEVLNHLSKIDLAIKKDSKPFNEFSLSFIKALKRNIDQFPKDDFTWAILGDGFVIKKLRK